MPVLLALAAMLLVDCTLGPSLDDLRGLPCKEDTDCPILGEDCRKRACVEGRCTYDYPSGEVLEKPGDCQKFECDGTGEPPLLTAALNDSQSDDNPCTVDQCQEDMTSIHVPGPTGIRCDDDLVCNADGECVECITSEECAGKPGCTEAAPCRCGLDGSCRPQHCANMAFDPGTETDTDCGNECSPCPDGSDCDDGPDCQSQVCASNACQAPSCTDETRNGDETGEDCGGQSCDPCADGEHCIDHDDCVSDVCLGQTCQPPTCSDVTQNGNETDIDCGGGPPCDPCGPGKLCELPRDCVSGNCRLDDTSGQHVCG